MQTRTEIAALQRELGVTTLYVTHDQTETQKISKTTIISFFKAVINTFHSIFYYGFTIFRTINGFIGGFAGALTGISTSVRAAPTVPLAFT